MSSTVNFLFEVYELARTIRVSVDQHARQYGMTRAQWAVLAKIERSEGLKQTELADLLELQPITLTRLIDRLCDNGLIERRADDQDRRAKRLYLLPAAHPILDHLRKLRAELTAIAFRSIDDADARRLMKQLNTIKQNIRDNAGQGDSPQQEQAHG